MIFNHFKGSGCFLLPVYLHMLGIWHFLSFRENWAKTCELKDWENIWLIKGIISTGPPEVFKCASWRIITHSTWEDLRHVYRSLVGQKLEVCIDLCLQLLSEPLSCWNPRQKCILLSSSLHNIPKFPDLSKTRKATKENYIFWCLGGVYSMFVRSIWHMMLIKSDVSV